MNNWDFYELLIGNIDKYIISIVFSLFIYYVLLKTYIKSIFDPIFYAFFSSALACAVVIFLLLNNSISIYYFSSYAISQFLFIIGFRITQKKKYYLKKKYNTNRDNKKFVRNLYILCSISFIVIQLVIYKTKGIPLFMESRLEMFASGGGDGIFARLLYVTSQISLYLSFYFYYRYNYIGRSFRRFLISVSAFTILSYILSGSRSSFLGLFITWFCYLITNNAIHETYTYIKRLQRRFVIPIVLIFALLFIYGASGDIIMGLGNFALRIVKNGDVFYYAYPNGVIESLNDSHAIKALFKDILGVFRIFDWQNLPAALGIELFSVHHQTEFLIGPNSRMNFFGYVYFGYYGNMFFCFILGAIVGFIRKLFFLSSQYSLINRIFIVLVYLAIISIETDYQLTLMYVDNILIFYPILIAVSIIPINLSNHLKIKQKCKKT